MGKQKKEIQYTVIYQELFYDVVKIIASKIKNTDEAKDLTQDIFLLLYTKFEKVNNYRIWINEVIKYKVFEYFRARRHTDKEIDSIINDVNFTFVNGFRDARIIIDNIINEDNIYKNDTERAIFDLVAIRRYSYDDAAKEMKMKRNTIYKIYQKIQGRVLVSLKNQGIKQIEDLL